MQQAADVLREKTAIDNEQKTLLEQLNTIKNRLNDYESKRNEKNVGYYFHPFIMFFLVVWHFLETCRSGCRKETGSTEQEEVFPRKVQH